MAIYDVEVPTYLRVQVEAGSQSAAMEGALALVEELSIHATIQGHLPIRPGVVVLETQLLTLDDSEDNTPDIYPAEEAEG
jgi:hypothetical protein